MQKFWDQRYQTKDYVYGTGANGFFKKFIDARPPGRILLPGEGEGRNAVYAATKGWSVDAFDFSEQGRQKALRLAAQNGVEIEYAIADGSNYSAPPGRYDAVAMIYFHLHKNMRKEIHKTLLKSLKSGGHVVIEAFTPGQLKYNSGGPQNIDMLYTAKALADDFAEADILLNRELEIPPSAGDAHQGRGRVMRFVARKKM